MIRVAQHLLFTGSSPVATIDPVRSYNDQLYTTALGGGYVGAGGFANHAVGSARAFFVGGAGNARLFLSAHSAAVEAFAAPLTSHLCAPAS